MAKTQRRTSAPPGGHSSEELSSIGAVKRYLARLIQQVERGRITVKKANCLTQICNVLIHSILDHEIEARLAELEASHSAGWRPSNRTMNISTGGPRETEQKSTGTA